jgi:glycosyltransferase involved in cell wall biosynthesis
MPDERPSISVVIPTRNRPDLVTRAVRSVINQTYQDFEIVVVIDGPDANSLAALKAIEEPRLKIVDLQESVGGAEARNVGVRASVGEWIALLDDDDEWFPEKLKEQLECARSLGEREVVIASQYIDRNDSTDMVRPKIFQRRGEPISEYLFCTVSLLHPRQGFVQTSTFFARRSLFMEIPFTRGLKRNQETDWLLRAIPRSGTEVVILKKVLAIFHNEGKTHRIGSSTDWEYTFQWAVDNKALFTPRALAVFFSTVCLGIVMKQPSASKNALMLWRACHKHGKITPLVALIFFRNLCLVPAYRRLSPSWVMRRASIIIYR